MIKVDRNSKGFTLIELLIVIAIIGILAAIAIPAYTGYTKKSKMSGVTSAMGAMKNAIIAYYTEKGTVNASTTVAEMATDYGITLPEQYISAANVGVSTNAVNIKTTLKSLGSATEGGIVTLATENIANGASWTFSGNNNDINTLLPKQ